MFFRNDFTFGGNNGLTDFKFILGHDLNAPATKRALYFVPWRCCWAFIFSAAG